MVTVCVYAGHLSALVYAGVSQRTTVRTQCGRDRLVSHGHVDSYDTGRLFAQNTTTLRGVLLSVSYPASIKLLLSFASQYSCKLS